MKRLFVVQNTYFSNKMEAKLFRDSHGGHVSVGPDHWKFNKTPKTHDGSRGHSQGQTVGDGFPKRKKA